MKRILFVAQNMQIGGTRKALVNHLKMMPFGDDVSLFTFGGGPLLDEIPSSVRVIKGGRLLRLVATPFQKVLGSHNIVDIFLRIFLMALVRIIGSERLYLWLLKGYCKESYDVAISYFTDVPNNYFNQGTNMFVADYVSAKKKVAWIHTDPVKMGFCKTYCENIYKDFDRIICVSNAVKQSFVVKCTDRRPENGFLDYSGSFIAKGNLKKGHFILNDDLKSGEFIEERGGILCD